MLLTNLIQDNKTFRIRVFHSLWRYFPEPSARFYLSCELPQSLTLSRTTPIQQRLRAWHCMGLGYSPFARRYLGNLCWFLFLEVLRCFSSLGYLPYPILFRQGYYPIKGSGFPHSDIHGSMSACDSPWHFGAYPVLLRLLAPRHPPCALYSLTCRFALQIVLEFHFVKHPRATMSLVEIEEATSPPKDFSFLWEILRVVTNALHSSRSFPSENIHEELIRSGTFAKRL